MRSWLSGSIILVAGVAAGALAVGAAGQSPVAPHRTNELTLAGLRPGKDMLGRAKSKYKNPAFGKPGETSFSWPDFCRRLDLSVDVGPAGKIQTVQVELFNNLADCVKVPPSKWKTGRGLAIYDSTVRVIQLYGQPDSRNPSTKGGQQLELLHYAFDWAGPDVPQVMEVFCTPEKDSEPGQVVEITLAAAKL